jgi:S1-C subfamily serine protease
MVGFPLFARQSARSTALALAAAVVAIPLLAAPTAARGPDNIADVAEKVINAVVNISTSQTVNNRNSATPQLPPGSPFEEFFDEFFKNRRNNQQGDNQNRPNNTPRRVNSLGSGFIIDASGVALAVVDRLRGGDVVRTPRGRRSGKEGNRHHRCRKSDQCGGQPASERREKVGS